MKLLHKIFWIFFPAAFLLLSTDLHAQPLDSAAFFSAPVYTDLEEALQHPNTVYRLNLRGKRLKKFPVGILKFKNLQELNLSRNRLDSIPKEIAELKYLQVLNISSNRLEYLPDSIGKLKELIKLLAGKNNILSLPKEIGELHNLEILDLWSNQISFFPDELNNLKKLRWMDLRVIQIEDDMQKHIQEILPKYQNSFLS